MNNKKSYRWYNLIRSVTVLAVVIFGYLSLTANVMAAPLPTISSINPTTPFANGVSQMLTVNGTGFQANLTVMTSWSSGLPPIQNFTDTSFQVPITLGSPGSYSFRVLNQDGTLSDWFTFTAVTPVITPPITSPTVTTTATTGVNPTGITINGSVTPNGSSTTGYFQWGTTTGYGNTTPVQTLGDGTTAVSVAANIDGLTPNTTYHYQLVATNSGGTTVGSDITFTTPKQPLTIKANNVTVILGAPLPNFTATYTGFIGNDTPGVLDGLLTFLPIVPNKVGIYSIVPDGLTSSRYLISFVPGELTVLVGSSNCEDDKDKKEKDDKKDKDDKIDKDNKHDKHDKHDKGDKDCKKEDNDKKEKDDKNKKPKENRERDFH